MQNLQSFIEWFEQIHHLEAAYADREELAVHREASHALFLESQPFLKRLPYSQISAVLDVGLGYGYHCDYFVSRGLRVTGITAHLSEDLRIFSEKRGFSVEKMDMHFLTFSDETFDLVWSHHSLEHSFSVLLALREWYRVLKPGGFLALTVPCYKTQIVSGHFDTGWNVGQVLYLLGVCGYDLRSGLFTEERGQVRALVKKPANPIDPMGVSWMFSLEKQLPQSVRKRLNRTHRSLGQFAYEGDLKQVTDTLCVPKRNILMHAIRRWRLLAEKAGDFMKTRVKGVENQ